MVTRNAFQAGASYLNPALKEGLPQSKTKNLWPLHLCFMFLGDSKVLILAKNLNEQRLITYSKPLSLSTEGRCVSVAPPCRTTATSRRCSRSRRTRSGSPATTSAPRAASTTATGCAASCRRWSRSAPISRRPTLRVWEDGRRNGMILLKKVSVQIVLPIIDGDIVYKLLSNLRSILRCRSCS